MPRIWCVIPMYGKEEYTNHCIDLATKNSGVDDLEILVVDDGSEKPFEGPIRINGCKVWTMRLDENSGFTNATNKGILMALSHPMNVNKPEVDYIHCLNNDTEPKPDFIRHLLNVMEADPRVGIAGSVREYPDGRVELCGADLIRGHQYFADPGMPMDPIEVNWLPICSGLIRTEMIRYIGLLDPRFRNHCSDSDYCLRAKMWRWKVILVPQSRVIHHLSVTTTSLGVNAGKDQQLFIEKLAGLDYAALMKEVPLDIESKTYGKLDFTTYQK